jgi:hypothetical protein
MRWPGRKHARPAASVGDRFSDRVGTRVTVWTAGVRAANNERLEEIRRPGVRLMEEAGAWLKTRTTMVFTRKS